LRQENYYYNSTIVVHSDTYDVHKETVNIKQESDKNR